MPIKSLWSFLLGVALAGAIGFYFVNRKSEVQPEIVEQIELPAQPETVSPPAEVPEPAALAPKPNPLAQVSPSRRAEQPSRKAPAASKRKAQPETEIAQNKSPETPAPAATAPAPQPAPEQTYTPSTLPPPPPFEERKPEPPKPNTVTVPAGTLLTVRLDQTLSSDENHEGDTFRATLDQPLVVDGFVIAERGARVNGKVASVVQSGRVRGLAQIGLELTSIRSADGQTINVQTESFSRQAETSKKSDAAKIGAAAGIGAAIGAIAGGGKGAAIGAAVGGASGAGGVMATRGKPAQIPAETRLSFKTSNAVTVTEQIR